MASYSPDKYFIVKIYKNTNYNDLEYQFNLGTKFYLTKFESIFPNKETKKLIKLTKLLSQKHHEIEKYIKNRAAFNEISAVYKLLPVKHLRKKKLENLKMNNDL